MRKRKIKSIVWTCGAVLVVALLVALPFLMELRTNRTQSGPSILSAQAQTQEIRTELCGTGTLRQQDPISVGVPEGVKISELLVKDGQLVEKGDALAKVDPVSVMDAITHVQQTLDALSEQIESASDSEDQMKIEARVGGRVMKLWGEPGDSVRSVMLAHGALAVVSLDGLLEVRFSGDAGVSVGDSVKVTLSDGTQLDGRVASALGGDIGVTVSDELAPYGVQAIVSDQRGNRLGSGELRAHNEWRTVAYAGTVDSVSVSEGESVSAGQTICTLTGTNASDFERLTASHWVYERILTELFVLYQKRIVYAEDDGTVTLPEDTDAYLLSSGESDGYLSLLVNAPTGDDEAAYVNFAGMVTEIGEDGILLNMRPMPLEVTDYLTVSVSRDEMTVPTVNSIDAGTPVFFLQDGAWQQGSLGEIAVGDVLLFAYTMDSRQPVWIVRLEQDTDHPDDPDDPDPGQEPDTPDVPTPQPPEVNPNLPFDPSLNGGLPSDYWNYLPDGYENYFSKQGGGYAGLDPSLYAQYGGTPLEQEAQSLYSDAKTELMTVTPMEEMMLEIAVDELDVLLIRPGQAAVVTVDALSGRSFHTTVSQVAAIGQNSGGNSKFTVTLHLERIEQMLDGMNASAIIPIETYENILTVPVSALVELGSKTWVYRAYDQNAGLSEMTEVTTGVSDGERVQILSGLQENDTVWYEYYDKMEISNKADIRPRGYFG